MKLRDFRRDANTTGLTPGLRPVSVERWAMATWLGRARRLSNESRRAKHRDRGDEKNVRNDIQGAFAELFLYMEVTLLGREAGAVVEKPLSYMREHLYTDQGGEGAPGPDLAFVDELSGLSVGIDAKSFDCEQYKTRFAINRKKHASLRGSCEAYYCLLVPTFGRSAFVCELIPYAEVSGWLSERLGSYGDPSLNLPIDTFVERFARGADVRALKADVYTAGELRAAVHNEETVRRLREQLPALADVLGPDQSFDGLLG